MMRISLKGEKMNCAIFLGNLNNLHIILIDHILLDSTENLRFIICRYLNVRHVFTVKDVVFCGGNAD